MDDCLLFFFFFLLHYNGGRGTQWQKSLWVWNSGDQVPIRGNGLSLVRGLQSGSRPEIGAGQPGVGMERPQEWELRGDPEAAAYQWLSQRVRKNTTEWAARIAPGRVRPKTEADLRKWLPTVRVTAPQGQCVLQVSLLYCSQIIVPHGDGEPCKQEQLGFYFCTAGEETRAVLSYRALPETFLT